MSLSKEGSDWANLPKNVIDSITDKLVPPLPEFVRLGAVCKLWHAAIMENRILHREVLRRCHRKVPLLVIPTKHKSQEKRGLYNIIDRKTYDSELPVPYNRRCCGSSYGWIATLDRTLAIKLINPFTGGTINLPSVDPSIMNINTEEDEYEVYVKKVILSGNPYVNPESLMILALFGGWRSIAIIRPGEKAWTYTTSNLEPIVKGDALFHKGKFYAVDYRLGIVSVDVEDINPSSGLGSAFHEKMIIPPRAYAEANVGSYIVESSDGEILIVQKTYNTLDSDHDPRLTSIYHETVNFKVFKIHRHTDDDEAMQLVEVKNIGNDALFLGDNCSMSVDASRFRGCRSNSIYFTDDIIEFVHPFLAGGPHDMGIFSLESGCFERYYDLDPSQLDMPPSFFILPHPSILLK